MKKNITVLFAICIITVLLTSFSSDLKVRQMRYGAFPSINKLPATFRYGEWEYFQSHDQVDLDIQFVKDSLIQLHNLIGFDETQHHWYIYYMGYGVFENKYGRFLLFGVWGQYFISGYLADITNSTEFPPILQIFYEEGGLTDLWYTYNDSTEILQINTVRCLEFGDSAKYSHSVDNYILAPSFPHLETRQLGNFRLWNHDSIPHGDNPMLPTSNDINVNPEFNIPIVSSTSTSFLPHLLDDVPIFESFPKNDISFTEKTENTELCEFLKQNIVQNQSVTPECRYKVYGLIENKEGRFLLYERQEKSKTQLYLSDLSGSQRFPKTLVLYSQDKEGTYVDYSYNDTTNILSINTIETLYDETETNRGFSNTTDDYLLRATFPYLGSDFYFYELTRDSIPRRIIVNRREQGWEEDPINITEDETEEEIIEWEKFYKIWPNTVVR